MSYCPPPPPPGSGPRRASRLARSVRFLHTHPTRNYGWNWLIWVLCLFVAFGLLGEATAAPTAKQSSAAAAASSPGASTSNAINRSAPATATLGSSPSSTPSTTAAAARSTRAASPRPADTTGGLITNSAGAILPDSARTPGALNPAVTQANIHTTICVSGWTLTVRPSSEYTTGLKAQQLATGYAYHGDQSTSDYEEDHLISLELGGAPTSPLNLWPEPYTATVGARTKDQIENKLHALVCSGLISLSTAQHAITGNWWIAYNTYDAAPAPAPAPATHAAPPPPAPPVSTTVAAGPPAGATALCNDGTYSYSTHHRGTCSHHGGVATFYR